MNKAKWIALENAREGMFVPPQLTESMVDKSSQTSIMVVHSFEMLPVLHARGYKDVSIIVDKSMNYIRNFVDKYGYKIISEETAMKKRFDLVIGNPPYGKASNLAIDFLNLCKSMSDRIIFVLPKTVRNRGALARIDSKLHMIEDIDNDDDTFAMELYTCTQTWEVRDEDRPLPKKYTKDMVSDDFEFTSPDKADICICAIGRYQIGQVFYPDVDYGHLKNFDERSPSSHHFIKIHKDSALKRLATLQAEFQVAASNTVAQSALSKHDLIRIFLDE